MENAAKALLIAGAMILALLLLSVFAFILSKVSGTTTNIYSDLKESDITEFNQQFLNFQEKAYKIDTDGEQIGLTMQDVISIANLAIDNNNRGKMPIIVEVSVTGNGWSEVELHEKDAKELENLLEQHFDEKFYYCDVKYAQGSKLVGKIEVKSF